MSLARTASKLVRIAMAAVFGFMSLGHGPIMALAHSGSDVGQDPAQHTVQHAMHQTSASTDAHAGHAASHHGRASDELAGLPSGFDGTDTLRPAPTCHAFGCFAAIGPAIIHPPAASVLLLGQLGATPPRAVHSDNPEPADPPPRLQV